MAKKKIEENDDNESGKKYSDDVIRKSLGKYGAVYFPSEIKESIDDIIGNEIQKELLDDFFKALKKYDNLQEQLKEAKLTPNLTILLYGPPGTGKTTLARAFSKKYDIPICVVEADRLISSLLGDTIKTIRRVVDLAAEIAEDRGAFVIFFDEIDAIGSERSSVHEVGEIKRAVISFLQVIDRINYEGYPLAIIGATNHEHQLDSAIWRRFTFHLSFEFPDYHIRKLIIESFLKKVNNAKIGIDQSIQQNLDKEYEAMNSIAKNLETKVGYKSFEFEDDMLWNEILKQDKSKGFLKLTHGYSGSDIERGTRVALFKALQTELLTYDVFYRALKLVGGTAIHVDKFSNLGNLEGSSTGNKGIRSGPPEI